MTIAGMNIPGELVAAQRDGNLVLFVGAGVSMGAPSSLPSFEQLTRQIAQQCGHHLPPGELTNTDVILGELEHDSGVDVHHQIAQILRRPDSEPNRLHRALIALATSGGVPRIVTTNYDLHLSASASDAGHELREYAAPALPVGNEFNGLVYVHGNLDNDHSTLVATDRDFGRAYLTDAWAARFLERMFGEFVTVFIGYSHADPVMTALARGLGPRSVRYAFTDEPHSAHWTRLEVTPIEYDRGDDNAHTELIETVERWAHHASMGPSERGDYIAQLIAHGPPRDASANSELVAIINDPVDVAVFADHASTVEWLDWADTTDTFRSLFLPHQPPPPTARQLATWYGRHFITDEHASSAALNVAVKHGCAFHPETWNQIVHTIYQRQPTDEPIPTHLRAWLLTLIERAPRGECDVLEMLLCTLQLPDDTDIALALFEHLTRPQLTIAAAITPRTHPSANITFDSSDYWLHEAWKNVFAPNLGTLGDDIINISEQHLRRAHQLLGGFRQTSRHWDQLSVHRATIAPYDDGHPVSVLDVLIDACRDSLAQELQRHPERSQTRIDEWAESEVTLLRRLAIYIVAVETDWQPEQRLEWVHRHSLWTDHASRPELYMLLAKAARHASRHVVDSTAESIAAALDGEPYEAFVALEWICRHSDLESTTAHRNLDELRAAHPEFTAPEDPTSTTSRVFHHIDVQPFTVDELWERIDTDPTDALADLRSYHDALIGDGPNWHGTLDLIQDAAAQDPLRALTLLGAAERTADDYPELATATIRGWTDAEMTSEHATQLLSSPDAIAVLSEFPSNAMSMLTRRSDGEPGNWRRSEPARQLADTIWAATAKQHPLRSTPQGMSEAWSTWSGRLTEYWLTTVVEDWRSAGDTWSGLDDVTRRRLQSLLGGPDDHAAAAELVLAADIRVLHAADSDWTSEHLVGRFDWSADATRAARLWSGFLVSAQMSEQLLDAGLRDQLIPTAEHAQQLSADVQRQIISLIAVFTLRHTPDPIGSGWLRELTLSTTPQQRADIWSSITQLLREGPPEEAEQAWTQWMGPYWEERILERPRRLLLEEATAMTSWTLQLTESFPDAVKLATSLPSAASGHDPILRRLSKSEFVERWPHESAALLTHLLTHTRAPLFGANHVKVILDRLPPAVDDIDRRKIIDAAILLGIHVARSWLAPPTAPLGSAPRR